MAINDNIIVVVYTCTMVLIHYCNQLFKIEMNIVQIKLCQLGRMTPIDTSLRDTLDNANIRSSNVIRFIFIV